jgi:chromate transporter
MSADVARPSTTAEHADQATMRALCGYFARLGAIGFGGPVALVGYMQRDLVEDRRWISEEEYRDGLAIAQMAPGPLAAQLAMWLAFVRHGVLGATLASLAFIAPPFIIVIVLGTLYVGLGGAAWMQAAFYGIGPAAIAIITIAAYRLLPITAGRDPLLWAILAAVAAITLAANAEVALAFLVAGVLVAAVRAGPVQAVASARGVALAAGRSMRGVAVAGPLLPVDTLQLPLLVELGGFFIKAGAFVFGSGLAIVPFMHEGLVVEHQWLTEQQFVDSVAVGLITPGPVVITGAFVGFLIAGLPGALVGGFGVFLPVYLFVVLPGPLLIRFKDAPIVRGFVAGVSAAAAGAILGALVLLGQQAVRDLTTVVIAVSALVALLLLRRGRVPVISRLPEPFVVAAAGIAGVMLAPVGA